MSFLIFGAIYCFSGGCLFVCFFVTMQATILWWDILCLLVGYSLSRCFVSCLCVFLSRCKLQFFVDNQAAIAISNNPIFHGKTKHFNIKLFFLREVQKNEDVVLVCYHIQF